MGNVFSSTHGSFQDCPLSFDIYNMDRIYLGFMVCIPCDIPRIWGVAYTYTCSSYPTVSDFYLIVFLFFLSVCKISTDMPFSSLILYLAISNALTSKCYLLKPLHFYIRNDV